MRAWMIRGGLSIETAFLRVPGIPGVDRIRAVLQNGRDASGIGRLGWEELVKIGMKPIEASRFCVYNGDMERLVLTSALMAWVDSNWLGRKGAQRSMNFNLDRKADYVKLEAIVRRTQKAMFPGASGREATMYIYEELTSE